MPLELFTVADKTDCMRIKFGLVAYTTEELNEVMLTMVRSTQSHTAVHDAYVKRHEIYGKLIRKKILVGGGTLYTKIFAV